MKQKATRKLLGVGVICTLLSAWGILQLTLMGIFYKSECSTLLHDVQPEDGLEDPDEIIKSIKHNFRSVATNCWIAAAMYVVTLFMSLACVYKAKQRIKKEPHNLISDDEAFCEHAARKRKLRKDKKQATKAKKPVQKPAK